MKRRLREAAEAVRGGLSGLFGLRVYGESLCTRRIQSEMTALALVLVIQFIVDFWAWSRAWSYGLPASYFWPPALGLAFAMAILLFDRGVVVADTSGSRRQLLPLAGRAVLLVLISFITAIPVELAVFEAEITSRLEAEEKRDTDKIRVRALSEEEKTADKRTAEAQRELDKALGGSAVLHAQLDAYKAERARESATLLVRIDAQRVALNAEMQGLPGTSGRYGEGPAAKGMKAVLQEMETAKQAFDAETNAGIKSRETALAGKADKDEQAARAALGKRREEKEKTHAALRVMPAEELGKKYGGQWHQAKGFLARFSELRQMEHESAAVRWTVWGCRLIMVVLGMLVLGLKLLSSEEFRRYYSFAVQAAHGAAADTVQMAEALGYHDERARRALGYLPKVKDRLRDLEDARHRLLAAWHAFQQELARLSQSGDNGLCAPFTEVRNQLHVWWAGNILPCMRELSKAEENCRLDAVPTQAPSAELVAFLAMEEPWKVEISRLVERGWQDPTPQSLTARRASETMHNLRRQVEDVLRELESELHGRIVLEPQVSRQKLVEELEVKRHTTWSMRGIPLLRQMEDAERVTNKIGMSTPGWSALTQYIAPERLTSAWRIPDDATLHQRFGWQAPYESEPAVAPPPPVRPQPPVQPTTTDTQPATSPTSKPTAVAVPEPPQPAAATMAGDGALETLEFPPPTPDSGELTRTDEPPAPDVSGGDPTVTAWMQTGNGLHRAAADDTALLNEDAGEVEAAIADAIRRSDEDEHQRRERQRGDWSLRFTDPHASASGVIRPKDTQQPQSTDPGPEPRSVVDNEHIVPLLSTPTLRSKRAVGHAMAAVGKWFRRRGRP